MRTINSDILAQYTAGRTSRRGLIELTTATGTLNFTGDNRPWAWNSKTWVPGAFISVTDIVLSTGFSASAFTLQMALSPDDPQVPAELLDIYSLDLRDRAVAVYDMHVNPDTGAVISAEIRFNGRVDRVTVVTGGSAGRVANIECLTLALDYGRRNGRMATREDQRRRSATDKFLDHAALTGVEQVWWGRRPPSKRPRGEGGEIN